MTQEQLMQIEAWRESLDVKQNDEHIVNAMWLAEEMWERHHSISRSTGNRDFGTYMLAFCMTMMEYIWLPHDIIKAITSDLDDLDTMPEKFIFSYVELKDNFRVFMECFAARDIYCYAEVAETIKICANANEAEALTAILNHANKAGYDAVTRLSA